MNFWRKAIAGLTLSIIAAVVLAGCNEHTDKIRDITGNPSAFANKDVTVAGEVTKVYELPLGITDLAAYRINDGTGQAWVLSRVGAPREGDKVGLKGTVRPEGKIGSEVLLNVIEEKERKVPVVHRKIGPAASEKRAAGPFLCHTDECLTSCRRASSSSASSWACGCSP